MHRRLVLRATFLAALALCAALPAQPAVAATTEGDRRLVLVLDSSGSMKERSGSTTKIAAAKRALTDVVAALPDDAQVGMRVYGSEVFDGPGACRDSRNVVPVGPLDRAALTRQVRSYRPYGETPIGYALQEAAKDLGDEGQRSLLLVSDGEATCEPDPCAVAKQLRGDDIDLKVDVVGLRVGGAAERQLRCIARAGGGEYTAADGVDSLVAGMTQLSVRAFRPFAVSGTPVTGTPTPVDAPALDENQYVDDVEADGTARYYRVPKQPGETVHVAVTARRAVEEDELTDAISLRLETADGEFCAEQSASSIDPLRFTGLLTDGVAYRPETDEPDDPCATAEELLLVVSRGITGTGFGSDVPLRAEIVVLTEPAVSDVDELPAPVEEPDPYARTAPQGSDISPVVGGVSFSDAAELSAGTYRDTLRDGELLVYKVRADWGQSLAVTARLQPAPAVRERVGLLGVATRVQAYSPDRTELVNLAGGEPTSSALWNGQRVHTLGEYTVPVRYRNREHHAGGTQGTSRAGFYYVTLEMAEHDEPVQADVVLAVDVSGEVSGAPTYVDEAPAVDPLASSPPEGQPADEETSAAEASADDSGVGWLAPVLVAVVVALLGVVTLLLLRRRRPAA